MTLYVLLTGCPACGDEVLHAEETDGPVDLIQDVSISARYCPICGFDVSKTDGWDWREEFEVERVSPTQDRSQDTDTDRTATEGKTDEGGRHVE